MNIVARINVRPGAEAEAMEKIPQRLGPGSICYWLEGVEDVFGILPFEEASVLQVERLQEDPIVTDTELGILDGEPYELSGKQYRHSVVVFLDTGGKNAGPVTRKIAAAVSGTSEVASIGIICSFLHDAVAQFVTNEDPAHEVLKIRGIPGVRDTTWYRVSWTAVGEAPGPAAPH